MLANSQGGTFYLPIFFTRTPACMLALGLALVMQGEKHFFYILFSLMFPPSPEDLALLVLIWTFTASDSCPFLQKIGFQVIKQNWSPYIFKGLNSATLCKIIQAR